VLDDSFDADPQTGASPCTTARRARASAAGSCLAAPDILTGTAGSFTATTGWDFVTGIGSTRTLSGK
jgi:hypothetical protein